MKSEYEIEQLAEQWFNNEILFKDRFYTNSKELRKGYENGYTQCQKDMADKNYTEDDIYMALEFGRSHSSMTDKQFIESLNKQD
jgi:SET domain-containing protein